MILVKNSKFLSNLLFFEKAVDMYFYDFVYKKKGFLDYNVIVWQTPKNVCVEGLPKSAILREIYAWLFKGIH